MSIVALSKREKGCENLEFLHNEVYGQSFALYDKKQMEEFIEPFSIRFRRNGIDPYDLFKGKKCLDAGCGNGRGSLFMAMHGASEVVSLDISALNVQSTTKNAKLFGYQNVIKAQQSTLEQIAFEDAEFDFVWCNGVIMHTHSPNACLQELARVLKVGGKSWVYVYGSGGIYWYCVYKFRDLLKEYTEKDCFKVMKFLQTPTSFLAEYIDDWKTPYLRTYTNKDFSEKLCSLGFEKTTPLPYGTDYDTSNRISLYPDDKIYLGEGDLRYVLTKTSNEMSSDKMLSEDSVGSEYAYLKEYTSSLDEEFSKLFQYTGNSIVYKIASCTFIQRYLRDSIFNGNKKIDMLEYLSCFHKVESLLS